MKRKIFATLAIAGALCSVNFCTGFSYVGRGGETKYCGGITFTPRSETVEYATKNTEEFKIKGEVPNYLKEGTVTSCANIAGAVAIGYYDRFCEELIPDYVAYYKLGTAIKYKSGGVEVEALMSKLYTAMGTDVGGAGTTFQGFQNGMKSYVQGQGYSYQTEDIGNLNFEKYKTAVESGKPVAIFLDDFSIKLTGEDDGKIEKINTDYCSTPHVLVAYGYKIDTYYNANNQIIATRTYLKVATGLFTYKLAHLCLDGKSTLDKAVAITIN